MKKLIDFFRGFFDAKFKVKKCVADNWPVSRKKGWLIGSGYIERRPNFYVKFSHMVGEFECADVYNLLGKPADRQIEVGVDNL